mgnify:CR=1 FL=1
MKFAIIKVCKLQPMQGLLGNMLYPVGAQFMFEELMFEKTGLYCPKCGALGLWVSTQYSGSRHVCQECGLSALFDKFLHKDHDTARQLKNLVAIPIPEGAIPVGTKIEYCSEDIELAPDSKPKQREPI